jgi:hypothetical protein
MKHSTAMAVLVLVLLSAVAAAWAQVPKESAPADPFAMGEKICRDKSLFPFPMDKFLFPHEEKNGSAVAPTGKGPKIAQIEAKYGKPDRVVDEEFAAGEKNTMGPPPTRGPRRTLKIHYYGAIGFGVEPADTAGTVVWVTNEPQPPAAK